MITVESIAAISKCNLREVSEKLSKNDIPALVEWLSLKDNDVRYRAFLLLQNRSLFADDVYPYWDTFKSKLKSDNSYQRSIGVMLIAANTRWDAENRIEDTIDPCLQLLNDEKPITVRQCISSLGEIASYKPGIREKIASALISHDLTGVKDTMQKLILCDILSVLSVIRKELKSEEIEGYIQNALSGEILDKNAKKQVEALLKQHP